MFSTFLLKKEEPYIVLAISLLLHVKHVNHFHLLLDNAVKPSHVFT